MHTCLAGAVLLLRLMVYLGIAAVAQVISSTVTSTTVGAAAVYVIVGLSLLMAFQGICMKERKLIVRRALYFLGSLCVGLIISALAAI